MRFQRFCTNVSVIGSATQRWWFRAIAGAAGLLRDSTGIGLPAARQMAGGILEADLFVTDTNIPSASGIFSATLVDSPPSPQVIRSSKAAESNVTYCALTAGLNNSCSRTVKVQGICDRDRSVRAGRSHFLIAYPSL